MSVVLSSAIIQAIIAQGDTPDTPEEWIIAAMNLGGILASGDIKADGSVPFTGQETFGAGLKTDLVEEKTALAGVTLNGAGLIVNNTMVVGAGSLVAAAYIAVGASTAAIAQINLADGAIVTVPNPGDIYYRNQAFNFSDGANLINLAADSGWTASVGTASKAGIDSNDVIYTVGALQNLARTVVAIQNTLMARNLFVA